MSVNSYRIHFLYSSVGITTDLDGWGLSKGNIFSLLHGFAPGFCGLPSPYPMDTGRRRREEGLCPLG
jgi:hypothetical protein